MHPRGTQEAPKRHPGGTQEAPKRHPGGTQRHPGDTQGAPWGTDPKKTQKDRFGRTPFGEPLVTQIDHTSIKWAMKTTPGVGPSENHKKAPNADPPYLQNLIISRERSLKSLCPPGSQKTHKTLPNHLKREPKSPPK